MSASEPVSAAELDDAAFASTIGLTYVNPGGDGITRRRRGAGWSFHLADGTLLSGSERDRCLALAIPPAWSEVWICPDDRGHIQAVGVDEAGRRQYRYHDDWTETRRLANFDRMRIYGQRLAVVRRRLERVHDRDEDPRRRLAAAMVQLLDASLERIGSARSRRTLGHRGISTLGPDDIVVCDDRIELRFVGKGGVDRHRVIEDPQLGRVIAELDIGVSDSVWCVRDDGEHVVVTARDANELLRELSRESMTCKDFRTWGGSAVALGARFAGADEIEAVDAAADALGNTRSVARSAYVHPDVLSADAEDVKAAFDGRRSSARYDRRERALLALLEARAPLLERTLDAAADPGRRLSPAA